MGAIVEKSDSSNGEMQEETGAGSMRGIVSYLLWSFPHGRTQEKDFIIGRNMFAFGVLSNVWRYRHSTRI